MQPPQIILLTICSITFIVIGLIIYIGSNYSLNRIKVWRTLFPLDFLYIHLCNFPTHDCLLFYVSRILIRGNGD